MYPHQCQCFLEGFVALLLGGGFFPLPKKLAAISERSGKLFFCGLRRFIDCCISYNETPQYHSTTESATKHIYHWTSSLIPVCLNVRQGFVVLSAQASHKVIKCKWPGGKIETKFLIREWCQTRVWLLWLLCQQSTANTGQTKAKNRGDHQTSNTSPGISHKQKQLQWIKSECSTEQTRRETVKVKDTKAILSWSFDKTRQFMEKEAYPLSFGVCCVDELGQHHDHQERQHHHQNLQQGTSTLLKLFNLACLAFSQTRRHKYFNSIVKMRDFCRHKPSHNTTWTSSSRLPWICPQPPSSLH